MIELTDLQEDILTLAVKRDDLSNQDIADILDCSEEYVGEVRRDYEGKVDESAVSSGLNTVSGEVSGVSTSGSTSSSSSSGGSSPSVIGLLVFGPIKLMIWLMVVAFKLMIWMIWFPFYVLGKLFGLN